MAPKRTSSRRAASEDAQSQAPSRSSRRLRSQSQEAADNSPLRELSPPRRSKRKAKPTSKAQASKTKASSDSGLPSTSSQESNQPSQTASQISQESTQQSQATDQISQETDSQGQAPNQISQETDVQSQDSHATHPSSQNSAPSQVSVSSSGNSSTAESVPQSILSTIEEEGEVDLQDDTIVPSIENNYDAQPELQQAPSLTAETISSSHGSEPQQETSQDLSSSISRPSFSELTDNQPASQGQPEPRTPQTPSTEYATAQSNLSGSRYSDLVSRSPYSSSAIEANLYTSERTLIAPTSNPPELFDARADYINLQSNVDAITREEEFVKLKIAFLEERVNSIYKTLDEALQSVKVEKRAAESECSQLRRQGVELDREVRSLLIANAEQEDMLHARLKEHNDLLEHLDRLEENLERAVTLRLNSRKVAQDAQLVADHQRTRANRYKLASKAKQKLVDAQRESLKRYHHESFHDELRQEVKKREKALKRLHHEDSDGDDVSASEASESEVELGERPRRRIKVDHRSTPPRRRRRLGAQSTGRKTVRFNLAPEEDNQIGQLFITNSRLLGRPSQNSNSDLQMMSGALLAPSTEPAHQTSRINAQESPEVAPASPLQSLVANGIAKVRRFFQGNRDTGGSASENKEPEEKASGVSTDGSEPIGPTTGISLIPRHSFMNTKQQSQSKLEQRKRERKIERAGWMSAPRPQQQANESQFQYPERMTDPRPSRQEQEPKVDQSTLMSEEERAQKPGQKRKARGPPSPTEIPNPPGASYGMNPEFFMVSPNSEGSSEVQPANDSPADTSMVDASPLAPSPSPRTHEAQYDASPSKRQRLSQREFVNRYPPLRFQPESLRQFAESQRNNGDLADPPLMSLKSPDSTVTSPDKQHEHASTSRATFHETRSTTGNNRSNSSSSNVIKRTLFTAPENEQQEFEQREKTNEGKEGKSKRVGDELDFSPLRSTAFTSSKTTPHTPRNLSTPTRSNIFSTTPMGQFTVPDESDSENTDSEEEEEEDLTIDAQNDILSKMSDDRKYTSPWTSAVDQSVEPDKTISKETSPTSPAIPSDSPPSSPAANAADSAALARVRSQVEKYKPKTPSSLRAFEAMSSPPIQNQELPGPINPLASPQRNIFANIGRDTQSEEAEHTPSAISNSDPNPGLLQTSTSTPLTPTPLSNILSPQQTAKEDSASFTAPASKTASDQVMHEEPSTPSDRPSSAAPITSQSSSPPSADETTAASTIEIPEDHVFQWDEADQPIIDRIRQMPDDQLPNANKYDNFFPTTGKPVPGLVMNDEMRERMAAIEAHPNYEAALDAYWAAVMEEWEEEKAAKRAAAAAGVTN